MFENMKGSPNKSEYLKMKPICGEQKQLSSSYLPIHIGMRHRRYALIWWKQKCDILITSFIFDLEFLFLFGQNGIMAFCMHSVAAL